MTNRSTNADAVRTKLLGVLARQSKQGTLTIDDAATILRRYDNGELVLTMDDLPLEPGEVVAPSVGELVKRIQGE